MVAGSYVQRAHRELDHVLAALVRHRPPTDKERRLLTRLDELDECSARLLRQVIGAEYKIANDRVVKEVPVRRRRKGGG